MKRGTKGKRGGANDGDDNCRDNNDGENDDQKINSKSTFCPSQSRKGTETYSACVLGKKAALSVPWCARGKRVETGIENLIVILDILGGWDHVACT